MVFSGREVGTCPEIWLGPYTALVCSQGGIRPEPRGNIWGQKTAPKKQKTHNKNKQTNKQKQLHLDTAFGTCDSVPPCLYAPEEHTQ